MPPWRTTVEMRAASMPDSRATMASASSEVWRCWVSKSAGTYSASITGVIGSTLRSRTAPLQVCDSVAAVAIAGFARSVSARSIGTRMDWNICASVCRRYGSTARIARFQHSQFALLTRPLSQRLRCEKQHQLAAAKADIVPVLDGKVEHDEA